LSGTPTNANAGLWSITLFASDGSAQINQQFTIDVAAVNHAPEFVVPAAASAAGGALFSLPLAASDIDGDGLVISAAGLPTWLTLTSQGSGSATLSGTPTNLNVGNYYIELGASDGVATTTGILTLTVARGANHAPILQQKLVTWYAHPLSTWAGDFAVTDADGDAITFSAIGLPGWLKLADHGDGTASIGGQTPDVIGDFSFTVLASDGQGGQASYSTTITLAPVPDGVSGDTLYVWGTNSNDQIALYPYDRGSGIRVSKNGVITNYRAAAVKKICVYAFDGNDSISITTGLIPTYLLGGMGDDALSGGEGADIITGGGGRDLIFGNGGADRLNGSGGSDKIYGYAGSDRLFGGDGNDTLDGGYGIDWLRGEAGNDVLLSRDKTRDVLIGGEAGDGFTDYAQIDSAWDELHEIESLLD